MKMQIRQSLRPTFLLAAVLLSTISMGQINLKPVAFGGLQMGTTMDRLTAVGRRFSHLPGDIGQHCCQARASVLPLAAAVTILSPILWPSGP